MGEQAESFGELLRRHRTTAGLTQEALAERAGLSRRGIADLERGLRRAPYRDTVRRLIDALDLDQAQRTALDSAAQAHRGVTHSRVTPQGAQIRGAITSFVGREHDLSEAARLLGETQLLTLVGPGGIGKTRLALELGVKETSHYRDGVWLVELAAVQDPDLVPHIVIAALRLQDIGGRPPEERLVDYLHRRRAMLILDNCEHLVYACAALADRLVRSCPTLRILATSREVLRVAGEVTWSVPPLRLPPPDCSTPKTIESSEAGRLFVDRAREFVPTFYVTPDNALDVARVCERLDGIPLALELAAARVKVLAVGQIADRLNDALYLLTSSSRLAPARQQTLRATLDWSYTLLSHTEQRLFERLCVFAGGWTIEAAEAVCALPRATDQREDAAAEGVLDGLAQLVDKSLLLAEEAVSGMVRYRLLEPVRQYAEERLIARGEERSVRDRHADFFIALAERAQGEIHRPAAIETMDMLDREHDNVRAALRWLLANVDVARCQRLAGAMGRFWLYRSHVAEGEAWSRRALDLPGGDAITPHRASCLTALPVFANTRGDRVALDRYSHEELAISRQLGDRYMEGFGLLHVAQASVLHGDVDQARQYFQAGVDVSRAIGGSAAETLNLVGLANLALEEGSLTEAHMHAEAALIAASEDGWTRGLAQARRVLGLVAHRQGDLVRARAEFEAGLDFSRRFGARWWTSGALIPLGDLAIDEHEVGEARELLAEGLQLAYELGDWTGLVAALEAFARLAVALEQPLAGTRLLAAASAVRQHHALRTTGAPDVPPSAASALSLEESVEYALSL